MLFAWRVAAGSTGAGEKTEHAMKIYLLMILIGAILGSSYLPLRRSAKPAPSTEPDSLPA
jgi:hypothetical protein